VGTPSLLNGRLLTILSSLFFPLFYSLLFLLLPIPPKASKARFFEKGGLSGRVVDGDLLVESLWFFPPFRI